MNFRKLILATLFLLTPSVALSDWRGAFGIGLQYGGFPGGQVTYSDGDDRYNFGAGLVGLSIGYARNLTPKHTLGIQAFSFFLFNGGAVSYNYYFSGSENVGWRLGIDVGVVNTTTIYGIEPENPNDIFVLPSVGYQF